MFTFIVFMQHNSGDLAIEGLMVNSDTKGWAQKLPQNL
jgi:hypothetical protein